MKHAFEKAGFKKEDMAFYPAIERYLNSGGTAERAHALVDQAAAKMAGGGHAGFDSQTQIASPRQPHPDVGQASDDVPESLASARDPIPGSGHSACDAYDSSAADQESKPAGAGHRGSEAQKSGARPSRVPGSRVVGMDHLARSLIHNQAPSPDRMRAVREAGHSSVPTIFEAKRLPDGQRYGDIRTSDYVALAGTFIGHSSLLLRLNALALKRGKIGPRFTTKDVLSASEFKGEIAMAETINLTTRPKDGVTIEPNGKVHFVRMQA